MENLDLLTTEQVNHVSSGIDVCDTVEMLRIMNREDMTVPEAVGREIPQIAAVVDTVAERMKNGGRLFYAGAGTSGRIGILDASECPPTYGTDPELVQGIIAGGYEAVFKAVEGAEDSEELGRQAVREKNIGAADTVRGIAASGRTPFVLGAIREAACAGAFTVGLTNNRDSLISKEAAVAITPVVGPEVVMGSTRMKAGTSQKLVLNMISTSVMIKLGKVYGNLMVDLKPTNNKLVDRAARIIMNALAVDRDEADGLLRLSGFSPKTAIVMKKTGASKDDAEKLIEDAEGFVTKAIELHR